MSASVIRGLVGLSLWLAAFLAALSLAHAPGDWGQGVCGPWGCGPPLQALLAWRLGWFVLLFPAAWWGSRRLGPVWGRRVGGAVLLAAGLGVAAVAVYEGLTWLPAASVWQRDYFWQRVAFSAVTLTDLPIPELAPLGLIWLARGVSGARPDRRPTESPPPA